jgi:membrane-associated PAP2 superfamily phosphatase
MPLKDPRESLVERRALLKFFGIAVPAALLPTVAEESERPSGPQFFMRPDEIFTLFVSEMVAALPQQYADAARDRSSVLRTMIEAHGVAMATVLATFQMPPQDIAIGKTLTDFGIMWDVVRLDGESDNDLRTRLADRMKGTARRS